jgi:hypothetical protein
MVSGTGKSSSWNENRAARVLPNKRNAARPEENENSAGYSIFGIDVDRKHTLKWLFSQPGPPGQVFVRGVEEKVTFHCSQKVYVYSEKCSNHKDASEEAIWTS